MAIKLWSFLNTDIREFNWKRTEEVTKAGTDAAKAVLDLAKAVKEQGSKIDAQTLQAYFGQFDSLLDVLNSPLALIVSSGIPFAPLAVGILKLIAEATKKDPTLEQCMMLVSQTAYLDSLRSLLKSQLPQLEQSSKPASDAIAQQLKQLGEQEFSDRDAKEALLNFPNSKLAQQFNAILKVRLQDSGFAAGVTTVWCDRIAWNTNRFINQAIASAVNPDNPLAELYRNGGRELLERYQSIETYLRQQIQPLPKEIIFQEDFAEPNSLQIQYEQLYVPMNGQMLNADGKKLENITLMALDHWLINRLYDQAKAKHLLFIQGEAGRGKSVFCRMMSAQVHHTLYPSYTPILIRLRGLRTLANRLQDTLESAIELQNCDFITSDSGWLTDPNARFLFFLDGFDELILEERVTGGLEEFLKQVEQFQQNSHHRFVITGRPLALMQVERLISQTRNIERIEIQPMDDGLRQTWLKKWSDKAGAGETQQFRQFLAACPADVKILSQEPLLIYLLARMHLENQLSVDLFTESIGLPAKIRIYDTAIRWVLEKQRGSHNFEMTRLDYLELRQFLTEAATCVVQSGNEVAKVAMLEARLKDSNNPTAKLLEKSRQETSFSDRKTLNNLLTSFYLRPASGKHGGSIEFVHKSFGEFLFAERLLEALNDWVQKGGRRNTEFMVPDNMMHLEIYALLGYGGLTPDIVSYLTPRLVDQLSHNALITLFDRLNDFYDRWCDGEFIDLDPPTPSQVTMRQLKAQGLAIGQRQVDVHTGLNVMILCLELNRYSRNQEKFKNQIVFYPSGLPTSGVEGDEWTNRLLRVIHYSAAIEIEKFTQVAGAFFASANLTSANLTSANLASVNLENANLESAYMTSANLISANLINANLTNAYLDSANLTSANLTSANLINAYLDSTNLDSANLDSVNLTSANLTTTNLTSANLTSANLDSANLSFANLDSVNLTCANLAFANLDSANLDSANLANANLANANLDSANLANTNLDSANLSFANLDSANLDSANLVKVDLTSTDLTNVDLRYTNLKDITWDLRTKWDGVKGLETARNVPEALKRQLGVVQ